MEQVKKILYLLKVIVVLLVLIFLGTAVVQFGMDAVGEKIGIVISENMLYSVSGSCGIMFAAIVAACYVKKKHYTESLGVTEAFTLRKALLYTVLVVFICQVLSYAISTPILAWLKPLTEAENPISKNNILNYVSALFMAPIFEELLFRMSFYNLLRRKFAKATSIVICAVGFALIHGYEWQGFLSCLVAGLTFTLLYDKTGNIWYCIWAHSACNLFVSIGNALEHAEVTLWGIGLQYEWKGYVMHHPVIILAAVLFCGICWWQKNRKSKATMLLAERT